ncbi:hypothetical protein P7C73_g6191, partial [Tremellales sp. Uapishka_1]
MSGFVTSDPKLKGVLPSSFLYGAASASYQIEGAPTKDGKGPSVWDAALKGKENGDIACDSYHLWKDDIQLLKKYGCNTYRFSISWPRILPRGISHLSLAFVTSDRCMAGDLGEAINEAGIKYYSDLVDALLAANIKPFVTIYHWDHPLALEDRYRGFESENIIPDFVGYAKVLFERLGDRVKDWVTINEPLVVTMLGGVVLKKQSWDMKINHIQYVRTLILSHAYTVDLYRREFQPTQGGQIGITLNLDWVEPINDTQLAVDAAQIELDYVCGMFADPIYLGRFPPSMRSVYGEHFPEFSDEQWKIVIGSSDFFGLNSYGTSYATGRVIQPETDPGKISFGLHEKVTEKDGKPIGNRGHNGHPYDVPWGFRNLLRYIQKRYAGPTNVPIYITENGFATQGEADMSLEEQVNDIQRQHYYLGYLKEMIEAVRDEGVDVRGYMAWSLLDNLEWMFGYTPRFGITCVDRNNGCKRTPKDSAGILREIFAHAMSSS